MDFYLGQILSFAGNYQPKGWAFCHGQTLPIQGNQGLFSLLGNTYGGDAKTTFKLPDFRGRVPIHRNTEADHEQDGLAVINLGKKGGEATIILNMENLPAHTHEVKPLLGFNGHVADETNPNGGSLGIGPLPMYSSEPPVEDFTFNPATVNATTEPKGGGQHFENRQPFLGIQWIICLDGLFPTRP